MDQFLYLVFAVLVFFSFLETFSENRVLFRIFFWGICIYLLFFSGFRLEFGADYQAYDGYFHKIANMIPEHFNSLGLEINYVRVNYFFRNYEWGFWYMLFTMAIISAGLKFWIISKYSILPLMSLAIYFPNYFVSMDCGQIRQSAAMGIVILSFHYLLKKKWIIWFILVYTASHFHRTATVCFLFIIIYKFPLTKLNMTILLLFSLVMGYLTHFPDLIKPIAESIGFLDLNKDYESYVHDQQYGSRVTFTPGDISRFLFAFLIIINWDAIYSKSKIILAHKLYFVAVCMYFILRANVIFANRIPIYFKMFEVLVIPELAYLYIIKIYREVKDVALNRSLIFSAVLIIYLYCYTIMQKLASSPSDETALYKNFIWEQLFPDRDIEIHQEDPSNYKQQ